MSQPPAPPPPQAEAAQPPAPPQGEAQPPQDKAAKPPPAPPGKAQSGTVQPKHPQREKFIAAVSLVVIFLAGLTITIIWLPTLHRKLEYSVERASIGGYNLTSDGRLSGNFTFVVRANNPNKAGFSFYYDKIDATASYKDRDLFSADNIIPPFYQPRRNATTLNLNLVARDYKVANESLARDLRMERGIGGLNLGLKIRAKMRLKLGVLRVIHRTLKVSCGPLKVPFSSSSRVLVCDADIGE
ncbi:protein yls9 [Phtheirospermum japonicum]|uniref:Protein yls9 n=1 Tax=Phtheirospermum japonicum TaxID=374723 RepID=A0A830C1L4_9LAMI|nr:protein yls9 [Phtheirospermum japonicum]